ncbi:hypothetical protein [Sphaerimonospora mesophila]|uniref:hypothetical protein n=1 Tax=Sphaerimonospora mesophila TaxID=37483 RepID=UPI001365E816
MAAPVVLTLGATTPAAAVAPPADRGEVAVTAQAAPDDGKGQDAPVLGSVLGPVLGLDVVICVDLPPVVSLRLRLGRHGRACEPPRPSPTPSPRPSPKPSPVPKPSPSARPRLPAPAQPERPRPVQTPAASPSPSPSPKPSPKQSPRVSAYRAPVRAAARPERRRNPLGTVLVMVVLSTMIAVAAAAAFGTLR